MIQLLIVADDFTGGLDTGVQFSEKGIRTRVITNADADYAQVTGDCEVLVVVSETRHLAPREAYETVYNVVRKGIELGIPHIYKKTDSALRGNIGAELSAAMEASGADTLTFLPGMPALRRVTINGIHYIDGIPVAESVFGKDPFEPVQKSDVRELLALQSDKPAWNARADRIPAEKGILIVDTVTEADLTRAGKELKEKGLLRVTAGCAGFAAALPELLGLETEERKKTVPFGDGLFVLCGSVNPITQRQLAFAEKKGFTRIHMRPEQKLDEHYFATEAGRMALDAWRTANEDHSWMILDTNDNTDDNAESAAYARKKGMTTEDVRCRISGTLGKILPTMMRSRVNKTLMITGGDTLLQCMKEMRVWEMEPLYEVFPGVVLASFETGGKTRYAITKSGGFGEETLLGDLQNMIRESSIKPALQTAKAELQ